MRSQFIFLFLIFITFNLVEAKQDSSVRPAKITDAKSDLSDRGKAEIEEINRAWIDEIQGKDGRQGDATKSRDANSAAGTEKQDDSENVESSDSKRSSPAEVKKLLEPAQPLYKSDDNISFVSIAMRFALMLLLMIGAFYLLLKFVRSKSMGLSPAGDLVTVIASIPILQGRFIQIVDLAGKLLVIGVSDSGVNLISEIEDARTVDKIRLWQSRRLSGDAPPATFLDWISGFLKNSEYKFWNTGEERKEKRKRGGRNNDSFQTHLNKQDLHSQDFAGIFDGDMPSALDLSDLEKMNSEKELAALLKAQKKRISSMKKD